MIFLDTRHLVALLDRNDELHERALEWSRAIGEPVVTSELILIETINMLSAPEWHSRFHAMIDALHRSGTCRIIPAEHALYIEGLNLHRDRPDKEWSLTDCTSFVLMNRFSIQQALAYDHHYEQAGFEALLRQTPNPEKGNQ